MSRADAVYLDLVNRIIAEGALREDRTGTGTISLFSPPRLAFPDIYNEFPLITTKKVWWKGVVEELVWMLSGSTNIKPLVDKGVHIWDEWPHKRYNQAYPDKPMSLEDFVRNIRTSSVFGYAWGGLGPIYGGQWRYWNDGREEIDQIRILVEDLRNNPYSRRHILSAWNVGEIPNMLLPPCHMFAQFYVRERSSLDPSGRPTYKWALDCQVYLRSGDVFLGTPFNIAQYALLTHILAKAVGDDVLPGNLFVAYGDAHIYRNHIDQVNTLRNRDPLDGGARVRIEGSSEEVRRDLLNKTLTSERISLTGYESHPAISAPVAV